ncbi:hypothetical protein ACFWBH_02015 [Streptomyces sp. NPDC059999]
MSGESNLGAPTEEFGLPRQPRVPTPEKFRAAEEAFDVRYLPHHRWRTGN